LGAWTEVIAGFTGSDADAPLARSSFNPVAAARCRMPIASNSIPS